MTASDSTQASNGLMRATFFLPIHDDIGIPEGRWLLIGDKEFPELADQPIMVGDAPMSGTEGHTPMELRLWRIEESYLPDRGFSAANIAFKQSGRTSEEELPSRPEEHGTRTRLVAEITTVIRRVNGVLVADALQKSIEMVQRVQTSVVTLTGGAIVEILTQEQLPFLVHAVISPGPPEPDAAGELGLLVTKPFPSSRELGVPQMLDAGTVQQVLVNTGFLPLALNLPTLNSGTMPPSNCIAMETIGSRSSRAPWPRRPS